MDRPKLLASITHLTDARYFAAAMADWLLFDFNPDSEDYIAPEDVREIIEWLSGPERVGAFTFQEPQEIERLIEGLELEGVLLPASYNSEDAATLSKPVFVDMSFNADTQKLMESWSGAAHFVLRCETPWASMDATARQGLAELCTDRSIFLDIKLQGGDVADCIAQTKAGLFLKGSPEEQVGLKSFEDVDAILDQIS